MQYILSSVQRQKVISVTLLGDRLWRRKCRLLGRDKLVDETVTSSGGGKTRASVKVTGAGNATRARLAAPIHSSH